MAEQAQVTSVDAIEAFRANLVLYLNKTRPAVEQVNAEAMRTRVWVQTTQRQHWENELRLRRRKLEQAKEELFSARLSQFSQSTLLQTMAVQRAERAVEEAEGKLTMLKKWSHEIETRAEPLVKQVDQFQGFLTVELPKAIAQLYHIIKTLDAYTDMLSPGAGGAAPASTPTGGEPPAAEKGPA
jgi:hypothetical protein